MVSVRLCSGVVDSVLTRTSSLVLLWMNSSSLSPVGWESISDLKEEILRHVFQETA